MRDTIVRPLHDPRPDLFQGVAVIFIFAGEMSGGVLFAIFAGEVSSLAILSQNFFYGSPI